MLNKIIIYIIIFIANILFANSFANNNIKTEYNIEDLLNLAENNSYNIKSATFQAHSQKYYANQQKYWQNPVLNYNNNGNSNTYSISQNIPFYNKLNSKYQIEETQYKLYEKNTENLILSIKSKIFILIYQYLTLNNKIELAQKRVNRLLTIDKYLSNLAINSPTKKAQAQITKDRLLLIEKDLITYRNQLQMTWNKINIFLNLPSIPQKINFKWFNENNHLNKDSLINYAIENNIELQQQKLILKKYEAELSYTNIEQMPDINLGIGKQNNNANTNGNSSQSTNLSLSVAIPIPVANQNKEKIIGDKTKIKSQQYEIEFKTIQLMNLIHNDLTQYETGIEIAKKFPISLIKKSLDNLTNANEDFKKGILDFILYIELDMQEYQMIDNVLDNQLQLAISYANLMNKIGKFTMPY